MRTAAPLESGSDQMTTFEGSASAEFADETVFRDAVSRFATGVTIVTAASGGQDYGTTVSAFTSLSLEPPMLLVCLNRSSVTHDAIRDAGFFGVSVLAEGQGDLAQHFARKGEDKFTRVEVVRPDSGVPIVAGALASFECRVAETVTGGTHTVFLAEVLSAAAAEGDPLTYFRGKFGRLGGAVSHEYATA